MLNLDEENTLVHLETRSFVLAGQESQECYVLILTSGLAAFIIDNIWFIICFCIEKIALAIFIYVYLV